MGSRRLLSRLSNNFILVNKMRRRPISGQNGRPPNSTLIPVFDFVVAERPKYIPGTGPPLAPISAIPPHDKDGFIIDKIQYQMQLRYLVGYEEHPQLKVSVEPQNILDWVSRHALEQWESNQYDAEEKRKEEEELPALIAKEKRRQKRLEAMARAAQGIDGRSLKRKRLLDKGIPRKLERRPSRRGPGDRHRTEEAVVFTSPKRSQISQRPSLSTPSRGLADKVVVDPDSNDEDDSIDTDTAIGLQLSGFVTAQNSRSQSESTAPLDLQASSPFLSKPKSIGDKDNPNHLSTNLQRRSMFSSSTYHNQGTVAATSSREALKIYEDLERKKHLTGPSLSTNQKSPLERKSSIFPTESHEPESKEPEDEEELEYEIDSVLDAEVRRENGKRVVYYLIDWVGDYEDTWEPEENVSAGAITEYNEKRRRERSAKRFGGSLESSGTRLFVSPDRPRNEHGGNEKWRESERGKGQVVDDDNNDDDDTDPLGL